MQHQGTDHCAGFGGRVASHVHAAGQHELAQAHAHPVVARGIGFVRGLGQCRAQGCAGGKVVGVDAQLGRDCGTRGRPGSGKGACKDVRDLVRHVHAHGVDEQARGVPVEARRRGVRRAESLDHLIEGLASQFGMPQSFGTGPDGLQLPMHNRPGQGHISESEAQRRLVEAVTREVPVSKETGRGDGTHRCLDVG